MIENLELVIFDMDGLMFDTERVYCEAILTKINELQINVDMNVLYDSLGTTRFDENKFFYEEVPEGFDKSNFINDITTTSIDDMCISGVPKKPGLDELITKLTRNNIRMVVATSTPLKYSGRLLESAGITPFLEFIITGADVERGKPYPDIFVTACKKSGVPLDRALVLEDSNAGGKAARAAGIKYIIVPDIIKPEDDVKNSAYAVSDNLYEVQDLIFS